MEDDLEPVQRAHVVAPDRVHPGGGGTDQRGGVGRVRGDDRLDRLVGRAVAGGPAAAAAVAVAGDVGRAPVQRLSLNPLAWAERVWGRVKELGAGGLHTARSLGGAALATATSMGSNLRARVGGAITGALSAVAGAARSGMATVVGAAGAGLRALGSTARRGLAAAGQVGRRALAGAGALGRAVGAQAASTGRRALAAATGAGQAVVRTGTALAGRAFRAVEGSVGGLWSSFQGRASAFKARVAGSASALVAKAGSLGGRALDAARGVPARAGGSLCAAIGRATAWVYGKVAPLARSAWAWAKEHPAKAIALLLIPGGPLLALGAVLRQKALEAATRLFEPVARAVAAKATSAWRTATQWAARAAGTVRQWAGKALRGATAFGRRALARATGFGRRVLGSARSIGARVVGTARQWGVRVLGTATALGRRVWGTAKQLGGALLGVADRVTGGLASKVKGAAQRILGRASGVLRWVTDRARGLADRALASARDLAARAMRTAKGVAQATWDRARSLGATVAGRAKAFASSALTKGRDLVTRAGRTAVDLGRRAVQGARGLAAQAVSVAKGWGARAWTTARQWGARGWTRAKELGGRAWTATKQRAGEALALARQVGARLAPHVQQVWAAARRVGTALGIDKAVSVATTLGRRALDVARSGLVVLKDKVLVAVEKVRQARNTVLSHTAAGMLCKGIGCAYRGFIPKKGGEDLEAGLDLTTDLVPVVSTVKDSCTCLVGENVVTNQQVGAAEQGMACGFAALDVAGYVGAAFTGGGTAVGVIALRTAAKGGLRVGGRIIAREALEAAMRQGGRALAERLGKEGLQELTEKLGREGLQELAEKMGRDQFEHLARAAGEQGVRGFDDILPKVAKEAGEAAVERGAREVVVDGRKVVLDPEPGVRASTRGANGHTVKVTESGRLVVCTTCGELAERYQRELLANPDLAAELAAARKLPADEQAAAATKLQERLEALASRARLRPEAKYLGTKKHGVHWTEGPATAKSTGLPQGQWSADDLDYAARMAETLPPRQGGFFPLPPGSTSVVHLPDGTTVPATRIWVRNNGTAAGTFHGHPRAD